MGELFIVTGMFVIIFGGACMDSADMFYPIAIIAFGVLLIGLGFIFGGNNNVGRENQRRHRERRRARRVRDFTHRTL